MSELYIIGAGGHGVVVAEIAQMLGYKIIGFVDDDNSLHGKLIFDWPILGGIEAVPNGAAVALGIGNNSIRGRFLGLAREHSWNLPVLIHPNAVISPSATIGQGTVVMAQVAVNARAVVGEACILNTSCSVDHDCVLGELVHICPGANLSGAVVVGSSTLIGIGSCVRQCIKIGEKSTIGAGSAVVSDIPDTTTAYGTPCRAQPPDIHQ